jgi:uncharacterized protein
MKKPELTGIERRNYGAAPTVEKREGSTDMRHVTGYALKFNSLSRDMYGFQEQIAPGALDGVDLSDVVALFNHDKNLILARTSAKTLVLTVDKIGLRYEFDSPETSAGNDLLVSIQRGDVSGSSFAFCTQEDNWEKVNDVLVRTIIKFESIIDVSPVVFPAYPEADVANRSLEAWKKETEKPAFRHRETTKTMVEMYRR